MLKQVDRQPLEDYVRRRMSLIATVGTECGFLDDTRGRYRCAGAYEELRLLVEAFGLEVMDLEVDKEF